MTNTSSSFKSTFQFSNPVAYAADRLPVISNVTAFDQTEATEFGTHPELRTWFLPHIIRSNLYSPIAPTVDTTEFNKNTDLTATKIGGGGQASIFKISEGRGADPEVRALKVYRQRSRHTEGRMLQAFSHPHIIAALDVFRSEDDLHCITFKYVPGTHDLSTLLRNHIISPKMAIEISLALAGALHYIYNFADASHRRLEIIHGDIKPSNILITPQGHVQLIDFGISTTALMRQRRPKDFIEGTPRYIDPNIIFYDEEQSHHSDIHAVLVTLFEMMVGSPAKELLSGKYMHFDPTNYRKAVDALLLRFRSIAHQIWPDHIESFAEPMVDGILSYLYLGPRHHTTRLNAFQLSERLMTLLPDAPGLGLHELAKMRLNQIERSYLDDQKTIVANTLFRNPERHADHQTDASVNW